MQWDVAVVDAVAVDEAVVDVVGVKVAVVEVVAVSGKVNVFEANLFVVVVCAVVEDDADVVVDEVAVA